MCSLVSGFTAKAPVKTPLTFFTSACRSRSLRFFAHVTYASTSAFCSDVVISAIISCSGQSTMKVTPKMVSGRVVKISNERLSPSIGKKTEAPSLRPIQLRWISFSDSDHSTSSNPFSSRSA